MHLPKSVACYLRLHNFIGIYFKHFQKHCFWAIKVIFFFGKGGGVIIYFQEEYWCNWFLMSVIFVLCLCTCHIYLCATLNRWRSGRIRHQRLEDSPDNQVDSFYRITFPDKQQESVSFDSGIDQYDQTHRQWVLRLPLPSITGDIEAISAFVVREEKRF